MQHSNAAREDETYLTWQDLLDQEEGDGPASAPGAHGAPQDEIPDLLYGTAAPESTTASPLALPPDVQALMTEKERLEGEMARLTGQAPPAPEEERMRRMYPVRVHTKETRIEDRRLRRHDEQQRVLKQRVLEHKLVQARDRDQQEQLAAQRKRRALETALAKVRGELRAAEAEELRRRRAIERKLGAARAEGRQAEREAEKTRKEIEQALVQARWASDRLKALRKRDLERSLERAHARAREAEKLDERRAAAPAALALSVATKEKPGPKQQEGTQREQQGARVLAARRAEQAWEQAREEQRANALARLQAARAEAAELDRRDQKRAQKRDRFADGA